MKPSSSQPLWSSESVRKVSSRRAPSYRFTVNYLVTTSRQSDNRLCACFVCNRLCRLYACIFLLFLLMEGFIRTSQTYLYPPGLGFRGGKFNDPYFPSCLVNSGRRQFATLTSCVNMRISRSPNRPSLVSALTQGTACPNLNETPAIPLWFFLEEMRCSL